MKKMKRQNDGIRTTLIDKFALFIRQIQIRTLQFTEMKPYFMYENSFLAQIAERVKQ